MCRAHGEKKAAPSQVCIAPEQTAAKGTLHYVSRKQLCDYAHAALIQLHEMQHADCMRLSKVLLSGLTLAAEGWGAGWEEEGWEACKRTASSHIQLCHNEQLQEKAGKM